MSHLPLLPLQGGGRVQLPIPVTVAASPARTLADGGVGSRTGCGCFGWRCNTEAIDLLFGYPSTIVVSRIPLLRIEPVRAFPPRGFYVLSVCHSRGVGLMCCSGV